MTRIYGLNWQSADKTPDGTGLDPAKIAAFFASWRGPQLTIGLCVYDVIPATVYLPYCRQIRAAGHKVLLRPIDSEDMAGYSVHGYERRHQEMLRVLGKTIDIVECANEVNGSRGETDWPGPEAAEKMQAALSVWEGFGIPRLITLYWNNDDPDWGWQWASKNPPKSAQLIGWSDYQLSTPDTPPTPPEQIIDGTKMAFPNSTALFTEFGCEGPDDVDNATPAQRADMIFDFETAGGSFYWDAYKWLVSQPDPEILGAYKRAWEF